jgi:hypothetical protein
LNRRPSISPYHVQEYRSRVPSSQPGSERYAGIIAVPVGYIPLFVC